MKYTYPILKKLAQRWVKDEDTVKGQDSGCNVFLVSNQTP